MHPSQRPIKRGKSPLIVPGERNQIGIGHLFMPDDPGFRQFLIRNSIRPKLMALKRYDLREKILRLPDRRPRSRMEHEADQRALRNRASGKIPSGFLNPLCRQVVRDVTDIGKRDQHAGVEQKAPGFDSPSQMTSDSSSRKARISSEVTVRSDANTGKPAAE